MLSPADFLLLILMSGASVGGVVDVRDDVDDASPSATASLTPEASPAPGTGDRTEAPPPR
jgi:hypothetical protein